MRSKWLSLRQAIDEGEKGMSQSLSYVSALIENRR